MNSLTRIPRSLRLLAAPLLLLLLAGTAAAAAADEGIYLRLYPGRTPASQPTSEQERSIREADGQVGTVAVHHPGMTVSPPADRNTGAAVIVCPGGDSQILSVSNEGESVVHWLNGLGITGIILNYRLPVSKIASRPSTGWRGFTPAVPASTAASWYPYPSG